MPPKAEPAPRVQAGRPNAIIAQDEDPAAQVARALLAIANLVLLFVAPQSCRGDGSSPWADG